MAIIKISCPKCGQKVSGDESYYGRVVECPVCSSDIRFPGEPRDPQAHVSRGSSPRGSYSDPVPIPAASDSRDVRRETDHETASQRSRPLEHNHDEDEGASTESEIPSPLWGAISMVSGVLAIVTCVGGVIFAPLAIAFGHTALARARRSEIQPAPGQTLGAVGLTVGYASLASTLLILILAVYFKDTIQEWLHAKLAE